jgi:hypothetical protein
VRTEKYQFVCRVGEGPSVRLCQGKKDSSFATAHTHILRVENTVVNICTTCFNMKY